MRPARHNPWLRVGFVLAATAAGALIRWALAPLLGANVPFLLFIPAIVLTTWFGGRTDGLVTTGLALALAWFVFGRTTAPTPPPQSIRLIVYSIYGLMGLLIVGLVDAMNRTKRIAEENQRRAQTVLESIVDSYFRVDREWRVVEVNRAAEVVFGRSRGELVGKVMWDEYPRAVGTEFYRRYHEAMAEGTPAHFEAESGIIPRWFEAHVYPCDVGLDIYLRDITDRKRWTAALEEARDAAERANSAKDAFLASLSHELRTPLTPILMAVSEMEADERMPAEFRPEIRMIRRNVAMEARLIDDLLDVTRIVQGKLHLQVETVDAHAKVNFAIDICRSEIRQKDLKLVVELEAERHFVRADAGRLQQVMWNLIKNAAKFTPEGGVITIRTEDGEGDRMIFRVVDTGIGIEPDVLPRLFNAFEQGSRETTERFGGLGLGLAISKSIVEAHGGVLEVRSEGRGRGAAFSVELAGASPKPETQEDEPADDPAAPRKPMKILLVEDHADTARIMARVLRAEGHEVTTADSVASALACAGSMSIDLIVSDLGLPDGSGLDLMERLRPLPGIALSGYGMEDDVKRAIEAGFVAHMTKPVDIPQLIAAIDRLASSPEIVTDREAV